MLKIPLKGNKTKADNFPYISSYWTALTFDLYQTKTCLLSFNLIRTCTCNYEATFTVHVHVMFFMYVY